MTYLTFIQEHAHAKFHLQSMSLQKIANNKAKEDLVATKYKRRKVEQMRSWLKSVLDLQNKNRDLELELDDQDFKTPKKKKSEETNLSPLKPFQLKFGSSSQVQILLVFVTPIAPLPLSLTPTPQPPKSTTA